MKYVGCCRIRLRPTLTHRTCTLIQHHSAPSYNHVNPSLLVEFRSIILIRLNGPCGRRIKRIDNFSKLGISCLSKGMEWKQVRDTLQTATFTKSRFKSHTNSVFLHDRKRPADTFRVYELHSLFVLKLPLRTPEMKSHSPLSFVFFFFNQWTSNRCFSVLFVFFCCCCFFFSQTHWVTLQNSTNLVPRVFWLFGQRGNGRPKSRKTLGTRLKQHLNSMLGTELQDHHSNSIAKH